MSGFKKAQVYYIVIHLCRKDQLFSSIGPWMSCANVRMAANYAGIEKQDQTFAFFFLNIPVGRKPKTMIIR